MDHPHRLQRQLFGTFAFQSVRDGTSYVKGLNGHPVASPIRRRQLAVVDDVIPDDVLLYFAALRCDNLIRALTRCDEDQTAISIAFDSVVDLDYASVGHHHWHLDLLEQAAMAFNIRTLLKGYLVVYFRKLDR